MNSLDLKPLIRAVAVGLIIANSSRPSLVAAGNDLSLPDRISRSSAFYQPLFCVGNTPPADAENQENWAEVEKINVRGAGPSIGFLEQFVSDHPASPWAPSIHANLGRYYAERGRYTKAIGHWTAAWASVRDEHTGQGKQVGDFVLAHWCRLLVALGQVERLGDLLRETRGRALEDPAFVELATQTRSDYALMRSGSPENFKCGYFALNALARSLGRPGLDAKLLFGSPSPASGFSMTELTKVANEAGLDLVAAKWSQRPVMVIPSLVHWRENHYAALVEKRDNLYKVIDPALDQPRWFTEQEIIEGASGCFLVPSTNISSAWTKLSKQETDSIFGRGLIDGITDGNDGSANGGGGCGGNGGGGSAGGAGGGGGGGATGGSPGGAKTGGNVSGSKGIGGDTYRTPALLSGGSGTQATPLVSPTGTSEGCSGCGSGSGGPGGSGGTGGNGDSCSSCDSGMPNWEVSEPYITLWLYDEPIGYQPGLGPRVSFKLAYKQRESFIMTNNVFSLGPKWDWSWSTYIMNVDRYHDTMAVPGGGQRTYWSGSVEFFSHTLLNLTGGGYALAFPNGATNYYTFSVPINMGLAYFLTAKVDPFGNTNSFVYQQAAGLTLLKYVIDADGRTNTLTYTNASFPAQVTGVQDPFNRMAVLKYDSSGYLTNITDPVGLSSSFKYDTNGWVTSLTTTNGLTTFEHFLNPFDQTNEFDYTNPTGYTLIRAIRVVDAVGGTNVFMLRQDCGYVYTNSTTNLVAFMPTLYDGSVVPTNAPPPFWNPANVYEEFRNTFWWGPRQASQLPTNIYWFAPSDLTKARMRHWLHEESSSHISQFLELERGVSPDSSTNSQITWYEYRWSALQLPNRLPIGSRLHRPGPARRDDLVHLVHSGSVGPSHQHRRNIFDRFWRRSIVPHEPVHLRSDHERPGPGNRAPGRNAGGLRLRHRPPSPAHDQCRRRHRLFHV